MKLTKTSLLGLVGLIAALLTINGMFVNLNPYIIEAFFAIGTLLIYNFAKSDNTGGKDWIINGASILGGIVGVAGYFLDHPMAVDGEMITYAFPVAWLTAIRSSAMVIKRFIETGSTN